jgi:hypothetical protein
MNILSKPGTAALAQPLSLDNTATPLAAIEPRRT